MSTMKHAVIEVISDDNRFYLVIDKKGQISLGDLNHVKSQHGNLMDNFYRVDTRKPV